MQLKTIYFKLKAFLYKKKYNVIAKGNFHAISCKFEGLNIIKASQLVRCFIGRGSYIGRSSLVEVEVGRFCSLGSNIRNGYGVHPSKFFVSTHPAFYSTKEQAGFSFVKNNKFEEHKYLTDKYRIIIGSDVWIGNDVILMDGIQIGNGAIIATGSVVTKDVLPYEIVGGIPAKHIRFRFEKEEIEFLQIIKWWNKDIIWIKENAEKFENIKHFYKSPGGI
jgi:acetyltransferase-like isoleucine patch superfamily enzyme